MELQEIKDLYYQLQNSNIPQDKIRICDSLVSSDDSDIVDFHFHLLENRTNYDLFLSLRGTFRDHGEKGKQYLISYLKTGTNECLIAEAMMILGGHPYNCKEVLPYAHKYILSQNGDLRYRSIIVIGWVGAKEDLKLLEERLYNETDTTLRGYAATAMRQMWFRIPDMLNDILNLYKTALETETSETVIFDIGICIQDMLHKRFGLSEGPAGVRSKYEAETVRQKCLKAVEAYFDVSQ